MRQNRPAKHEKNSDKDKTDMKTYTYPSPAAEKRLAAIENRTIGFKKKDITAVNRIIENIKKNGDAALIRYTHQFDSTAVTASSIQVSPQEIEAAVKTIDSAFLRALNRAAKQIKAFHRKQLQKSWISTDREGILLGQLINPVDAAGIYVPGGREGKTPLVSTVLMCAIPAVLAGVKRISMVTPPMKNGAVNPHLLVAAKKAGVKDIYKAGSAWAIAALAYGTETIPRADVIVGPGNIYVTLAKKLVSGDVGIDMLAGPSEILIVADDSAVPAYIAADLLSQAEHDPLSSSILVTTSSEIAKHVTLALEEQLKTLQRKRHCRGVPQKIWGNPGGLRTSPRPSASPTGLPPSTSNFKSETRSASSETSAMPVLFSSATIHRNPWATILPGRITYSPRPEPHVMRPPFPSTILSRKPA